MGSESGSSLSLIIFLLLPLGVIGMLMWSQRRRATAARDFQASLEVGDEVVTGAGVLGQVTGLDEGIVHLEIAPGVVVRVDRRGIVMRTADLPTQTSSQAVEPSPRDGQDGQQ